MTTATHVILYDGVCGLCNGLVRFVLPRDRRRLFKFAQLQSPIAEAALAPFERGAQALDTFYVIENYGGPDAQLHWKSRAAFAVARGLGWWWVAPLRLVPRGLADVIYDIVARNRYRWFGKHDTCPIPDPQHRSRFL